MAISDISRGTDVHQFTADTLSRSGEPTSRQEAKSRTFKPLYGGMSGTKAERSYFKEFREKYSGIVDEQERWKTEVERTKELVTCTGLVFYWPDTKWEGSSRNPYLRNTTSICNYPVQCFATADIIPTWLTFVQYEIISRKLKSFIINCIHDSVIMEIHPDEVAIIEEIGTLIARDKVLDYLYRVYNINFNVPLEFEFKYGESWSG